jgi:carboxylesterase type B
VSFSIGDLHVSDDTDDYRPFSPGTDYCKWEQDVLVQQGLDTPETPPMSGTDCLNLNVVVPDIHTSRKLPVMAYMHGGGYIMGANWWPQKDPARLVSLSVETGLPVIVVNFK